MNRGEYSSKIQNHVASGFEVYYICKLFVCTEVMNVEYRFTNDIRHTDVFFLSSNGSNRIPTRRRGAIQQLCLV